MRRPGDSAGAWCAILARPRERGGGQDGFTIVEVVVTGLVVMVAMIATFGALEAAGRAGSEQRHHAESYAIAQQDQARIRALQVSAMWDLDQTRSVVREGTSYTVNSQASFVNSTTGTASCAQGGSQADYISIRTTVSWPSIGSRPPTAVASIVTPPNGAFGADRGTLIIAVRDAADAPIAGMSLSGSGAGTFSGETNQNGCAIFPNLPAGDYSLTPSVAAGLVDRDGEPPGPSTVSVVDQSTNTVVLLYDDPGQVDVTFTTRYPDGVVRASSADSVLAFNTGMSVPKAFGTIGSRQTEITAGPLFPFVSPDTFYAGACESNNPNPEGIEDPPAAEAMAAVAVLAGQTAAAEIQLPALDLVVEDDAGNPIEDAKVVITDNDCQVGGEQVKRTFATDAQGGLPDPGLPYGNYSVCASALLAGQWVWQWGDWRWQEGEYRRDTVAALDVKTTDTDTAQTVELSHNGGDEGQCS